MNKQTFFEKLKEYDEEIIIAEFWAPWCGPCKVMAPRLETMEEKFEGKVKLIRINIDEDSETANTFNVMSIPTMIAFDHEKMLFRQTGALPVDQLENLFESALKKEAPEKQLLPAQRLLRITLAVIFLIIAFTTNSSPVPFIILSGLAFFSAVHDRCPILKAIRARIKAMQADKATAK